MLYALLCALIILIIAAAAFYAAHYVVQLRHSRDILADEYKRATEHIAVLEEEIAQLRFERDQRKNELSEIRERASKLESWDVFQVRGG